MVVGEGVSAVGLGRVCVCVYVYVYVYVFLCVRLCVNGGDWLCAWWQVKGSARLDAVASARNLPTRYALIVY